MIKNNTNSKNSIINSITSINLTININNINNINKVNISIEIQKLNHIYKVLYNE